MKNLFHIKLVTPNGIELESDKVKFVKARAKKGDVGILANHANYITVLGSGKLEVELEEDKKTYYVPGGFLEVNDGNVILLVEDLIDYDTKDMILEERQKIIDKAIAEKLKEDQDVLGTKKKLQDSLKK